MMFLHENRRFGIEESFPASQLIHAAVFSTADSKKYAVIAAG